MARGYINDKPISYSSLKTWLMGHGTHAAASASQSG